MRDNTTCGCSCSRNEARQDLPGAAINAADNDKVNEDLVKERTKTINNNPRNTDDQMPG